MSNEAEMLPVYFESVKNDKPVYTRHPNCLGHVINTPDIYEFSCDYGSNLTCDECKYSGLPNARKDPEAKCNQSD